MRRRLKYYSKTPCANTDPCTDTIFSYLQVGELEIADKLLQRAKILHAKCTAAGLVWLTIEYSTGIALLDNDVTLAVDILRLRY